MMTFIPVQHVFLQKNGGLHMKKNELRPKENEAVKLEQTNPIIPAENKVLYRYSDKELEEFRELINTRLEAARKEVQYLQGQMRGRDETGADIETEHKFNIEDGSAAMEIEQRGQLAARQIQYINNLEKALIRISNKTYGVCRETGKLIDKARLRAVPHATLSMEAKKK